MSEKPEQINATMVIVNGAYEPVAVSSDVEYHHSPATGSHYPVSGVDTGPHIVEFIPRCSFDDLTPGQQPGAGIRMASDGIVDKGRFDDAHGRSSVCRN